jgi:hypothetical protein
MTATAPHKKVPISMPKVSPSPKPPQMKMDEIETLPYDETRVIVGIVCQTCGKMMSRHRGRFPICDDCLKVLREIIKERKENK